MDDFIEKLKKLETNMRNFSGTSMTPERALVQGWILGYEDGFKDAENKKGHVFITDTMTGVILKIIGEAGVPVRFLYIKEKMRELYDKNINPQRISYALNKKLKDGTIRKIKKDGLTFWEFNEKVNSQ